MIKYINNPFLAGIVILQIGAFTNYFYKGYWRLGLIMLFYSLANIIFLTLKG